MRVIFQFRANAIARIGWDFIHDTIRLGFHVLIDVSPPEKRVRKKSRCVIDRYKPHRLSV